VAVVHSGLSLGQQFDQWRRIRDGHYAVVVGARSAVFAPQPDLGLIVMDEEHEWTYKQEEPAPRYHTRAVAEKLAELTGAVLVLGSATPDLESYHRARAGRYRLLALAERVQPAADGSRSCSVRPLPGVEVVDLRQELKAGNRSIFSRSLGRAVAEALAGGEQVILFLNRRGAASFVQCRDCGHVPTCSACAVSLTYHASEQRLICHHCHRSRRLPERCPQCQSPRIRFLGIGTEKVEEEAGHAFPGARLLRWDRDVTRRRGAHERILARFLAHEADILIGTQMIAKGLDMPAVTLVGAISADVGLNLPDYRSGERTFQLLEQVAGRAGRGPRGGRVIIQTYTPHHYAIEAAARHDYDAFYEHEASLRRRLGYPPFGRLARLVFAHTNAAHAQEQALRMAAVLRRERDVRGIPNLDVLGPAPALVPKVRGRYRWQITLRGGDPAELLGALSFSQGWTVDIDPVSLL
jgi:primosomal protein N' (replication factor Y)